MKEALTQVGLFDTDFSVIQKDGCVRSQMPSELFIFLSCQPRVWVSSEKDWLTLLPLHLKTILPRRVHRESHRESGYLVNKVGISEDY